MSTIHLPLKNIVIQNSDQGSSAVLMNGNDYRWKWYGDYGNGTGKQRLQLYA